MPAGDWARAGRVSSQRYNNAMTAVAVNSVDPNKLIQESMRSRSREKQMALAAESTLRRTQVDANKFKEITNARLEERQAGMDLAKAKRKAGMLAAGAAVIGQGLMKTPDPIKPYMKDTSALEDYIKNYDERTAALQQEFTTKQQAGPTQVSSYLGQSEQTSGTLGDQSEQTAGTLGDQAKATDPTSVTAGTLTGGWKPLSAVISFAEGTSGPKGYQTQFTGTTFSDMSKHPRQLRSGGGYTSDAAGKYQFLSTTWDEARRSLNLQDFSPQSQEKAGEFLAKRRGLNTDQVYTNIGDFTKAIDKIAPEWAGLPYSQRSPKGYGMGSSYYGQGGKDIQTLWNVYQQNL